MGNRNITIKERFFTAFRMTDFVALSKAKGLLYIINGRLATAFAIIVLLILVFSSLAFGSMKLKEEISLTGASLKELTKDSIELSGLTEVGLKNYEIAEPMTEADMESFSEGYIERFSENDWQMVLKGMNKGRIIMVFSLEKDNVREKLMVVVVSPTEVSEMTLSGTIQLSALDELRDAILKSIPKFGEFKSLEDVLQEDESSPSSQMGNVMERWIELINQYGDEAPPVVFLELARAYEEMGIYDKALELYVSLINNEATPWMILIEVCYKAGVSAEMLERYDDAEKYYRMVIQKAGEKNVFESDYVAGAESALLRAKSWKTEPMSVKTLMRKADDLFFQKRDYNSAINAYKVIIENMPESGYVPSAMLMMGRAYGRLGKTFEQLETLKKAVEKYPNTVNHIYLAMAYQNADLCDEALNQYQEVIKNQEGASDWQTITAYYNAGICSHNLGKQDDTIKYFKVLAHKYEDSNSPIVADAEREVLKIERGDKLPFLGVGFRYRNSIDGAYIITVFKNGPSLEAGVQRGDLLIAIDSEATTDPNVASRIIAKKNIGDTVKLTLKRGNETITRDVTLTSAPEKLER